MIVVHTVADLREALLSNRTGNKRIGLVPTMGAFHAGHLHLMQTAREECDVTVVTLFVNPMQFGDPNDLAAYPRNNARDVDTASSAGVDILFAPSVPEMYPEGFSATVDIGGVTETLEGKTRGIAHFRGVATVVAKLFNIVQPHAAYFGQKDAQQVAVIRQMVRDLNIPVKIEVCSIMRESDGLAMSSRNARLSPASRMQAVALSEALHTVQTLTALGERSTETLLNAARTRLHARDIADHHIEYLAAVDNVTLADVSEVADRHILFALAVRVGDVRLIDNVVVEAPAGTHMPREAQ
ncbi:MAG: pantoate--beta-alanine ligase [Gemmatimonas sp.]